MQYISKTLLCLLLSLSLYAQTKPGTKLVLYGKYHNDYFGSKPNKNGDRIFYRMGNDHFDEKFFIRVDSLSNFNFDLTKSRYKSATKGEITFSNELSAGCENTFKIEELVKLYVPNKAGFYRIKTDLIFTYDCYPTVEMTMSDTTLLKFEGDYIVTSNNKETKLHLSGGESRWFSANSDTISRDRTNRSEGYWDYNKKTNQLTARIKQIEHAEAGIRFLVNETIHLPFKLENGKVVFIEDDKTKIRKVN